MKKIILAAILACSSNTVFGNDFSQCEILEIINGVDQKNTHLLLNCVVSNRPTCAGASNYVAIDTDTERGQKNFATAMLAFSNDYKVRGFINRSSCPSFQNNVAELIYFGIQK